MCIHEQQLSKWWLRLLILLSDIFSNCLVNSKTIMNTAISFVSYLIDHRLNSAWAAFNASLKLIPLLCVCGHTRCFFFFFDKLESLSDSPVNSRRAAYDWECSLGLGCVVPAFYTSSRDCWFWSFEGFIAIQIKRNHSASEFTWSVLPGGGGAYKDKTVKYTQGTPRITGSVKCQNLLWSSFAPLVVPVMLRKLNFCIPSWRRKQRTQC